MPSSTLRLLIVTAALAVCACVSSASRTRLEVLHPEETLGSQERGLRHTPLRVSEFSPLVSPLAPAACADSRPPEPLATPDPLLQWNSEHIRVSFIVNRYGEVESPLILESAGPADDQIVLMAVRFWRFRPALCNGVPTAMEDRVGFDGPAAHEERR